MTLWPEARHEILNETNRDEVEAEIVDWLDAHRRTRPRPAAASPGMSRPVRIISASCSLLVGALWTLQGLGYVGGSAMSGVTLWAIIGPIVALAGLGLALIPTATPALTPRPRSPPVELRGGSTGGPARHWLSTGSTRRLDRGRPGQRRGRRRGGPGLRRDFRATLVELERWVDVGHQGGVRDDAVDPAVEADDEVEERPRVAAGEEEREAGDAHQQPDDASAEMSMREPPVLVRPQGPTRRRRGAARG